MKHRAAELQRECEALHGFLSTLKAADWQRQTVFFSWSVADEVMHLHFVDLLALKSLTDAEAFASLVKVVRAKQAQGIEMSAQMRDRFGSLKPEELLREWRLTWLAVCGQFEADDPQRRVPWFGPSMKVSSSASARQMEVWAHGQDIYDLFGVRRTNSDSIRNICELGVKTFRWSFENRKEAPPPQPPTILLTAPSGEQWQWNPDGVERIEGTAEDFALVVTQRRNVADTKLIVEGPGAKRFMAIAQCFAGPPETPPAAGARVVTYASEI